MEHWSWDFGDSSTSPAQNPTHHYNAFGTYTVTLVVTDNNGASSETSQQIIIRDSYEPDDSYTEANWIKTDNTKQFHNFHVAGDHDWIKFNATAQTTYAIKTSDLGPDSDTYLYLYNTDGTTLINSNDDGGGGLASRIVWACPSNGVYYGMVRHWSGSASGPNTYYNLSISIENYPPKANFTFIPSNPTTASSIQFNDSSTDSDGTIASRAWSFGDGGTSILQNPTHRFTDEGTYTVFLNATDDDGATNTKSRTVTVTNLPPTANYTYSPTNPTTASAIHFTDTSTDSDGTIASRAWSFGDGISYPQQNPIHRFVNNGVYTVILTVTDDDGATATKSRAVTVTNLPPTANFTIEPSHPTVQDVVYFNDTSNDSDGIIVSWLWIFGDGTDNGTTRNTVHVYINDGTYTITLRVTDDDGATNNKTISLRVTAHADIIVDDDAEPTWYDATHVKTIQEGIHNATTNQTIYVYNGTYHEHLTINKSLMLWGEDKETTIIDGDGTGTVINISANHTILFDFTIQNSGSTENDSSLMIHSSSNIIMSTIIRNTYIGMYLKQTQNNTIIENEFIDNGYAGIFSNSSSQCIFYDNIIRDMELGIYLLDSTEITVEENTLIHNNVGLILSSSSGTISNNTIKNNTYGIYTFSSSDNTITNNKISNSSLIGIYMLAYSYNNIISKNTFNHNVRALALGPWDTSSNSIYHNNFINNTEQVYDTASNTWDDGYPSGGNYWSDYNGSDNYIGINQNITGSDTIGDIPYNITGGNSQDHYPLMYPFEDYFTLKITAPSQVNEAERFAVTVTTLLGEVVPGASVEFDNQVTLTDAQGKARFTVPSVTADTEYQIFVSKTNFTGNSTTILVKNIESYGGGGGGGGGGYTLQELSVVRNKPTAHAGGPYVGFVNTSLHFDGSKSNVTNGTIRTYVWGFGDNTTGNGKTVTHIYTRPGNFTVALTVTDNNNQTSTDHTSALIIQQQNNQHTEGNMTAGITNTTMILINTVEYELRDTDGDGIYDTLHNNNNGKDTDVKLINGMYVIDENGDGQWDYQYNPATGLTASLGEKQNITIDMTILYVIIAVGALFAGVALFFILKTKQRLPRGMKSPFETGPTPPAPDSKEKPHSIDEHLASSSQEIERHIDHIPDRPPLNDSSRTNQINEGTNTPPEKQDLNVQLLKIIYASDIIDADVVAHTLGVSLDELKHLVDTLVEYGLLQYSSDHEAELTEKGIKYLTLKNQTTAHQTNNQ